MLPIATYRTVSCNHGRNCVHRDAVRGGSGDAATPAATARGEPLTDDDNYPDPVLLPGVLHTYGDRWQIGRDEETSAWTAVERPSPTALHVVVAYSIGELAEKLAKQEGDPDVLPRRRPGPQFGPI
jgi:hypothetical protein